MDSNPTDEASVMEMQQIQQLRMAGVSRRSTFAIVAGLLVFVGFVQMVMLGMALIDRVGETRVVEVKEEGEVKVVYIPTLADEVPKVKKAKARSYEDLLKTYGADTKGLAGYRLPDITKSKPARVSSSGVEIRPSQAFDSERFPRIKSSRVEKLVEEAKSIHLSGDVVKAILKLEEAESIDSNEPAVMYRRALIYESMRNWERASDQYNELFMMGADIGAYYDIAVDKIANGVKDAPDVVPFQLGNVVKRVGADELSAQISIPVRRLSTRQIEPSQIDVRIFFYDIVDNKEVVPVPQQREVNIQKRWVTDPVDWEKEEEEVAQAVYTLPALGRSDVHLFGERRYFGHVVELYYKGELMDQYAYPGRLHGIHAKDQYEQHYDPNALPFGVLPGMEGVDGEGMLLPTLDE